VTPPLTAEAVMTRMRLRMESAAALAADDAAADAAGTPRSPRPRSPVSPIRAMPPIPPRSPGPASPPSAKDAAPATSPTSSPPAATLGHFGGQGFAYLANLRGKLGRCVGGASRGSEVELRALLSPGAAVACDLTHALAGRVLLRTIT